MVRRTPAARLRRPPPSRLRYHARVVATVLLAATLAPPPPAWREVRLEARKLWLEAEAAVSVERCPLAVVARDLRTPPLGDAALPATSEVDVVRVRVRLPGGRAERITVWLDAATGAVLQSAKRRFGRGAYWKVRRYTDDGYYEWRTEPDEPGDLALPPPRWSDEFERRVVLDPPTGAVVTDPYALLAAMAQLERATGPVVVATRRGPAVIRLVPSPRRPRPATLAFRWPGGSGTLTVPRPRAVRVQVTPPAGLEPEEVRTGIFGMRGDLEIVLDPRLGIPLEIRGRARHVGRVRVRAVDAELRAPGGRP